MRLELSRQADERHRGSLCLCFCFLQLRFSWSTQVQKHLMLLLLYDQKINGSLMLLTTPTSLGSLHLIM